MKPLGAEFRMHAGIAGGCADILRVISTVNGVPEEAVEKHLRELEDHVKEMRRLLAERVAERVASQQV